MPTQTTDALSCVDVNDIALTAEGLDISAAADIYRQHGCLVVRGLLADYVPEIHRDIEQTVQESLALLDRAERIAEGWRTPNGTLFLPAPEGFHRDRQIMVLGFTYHTSAAFFRSAMDERLLDIVEAVIGPDVELFGNGQSLYKEPVGGHPKKLHQDGAYFEHRFEGPVAVLTYVVETTLLNGALHVVPGSHHLGMLEHVDTFSHLGLSEDEWPWESALPVEGGPGDAIFFHVKTIHGSQENHSDGPRPVFIHRYRRPGDYVVVSATTAANRKRAEQRRQEAKGDSRGGIMVRGFRSALSDECVE